MATATIYKRSELSQPMNTTSIHNAGGLPPRSPSTPLRRRGLRIVDHRLTQLASQDGGAFFASRCRPQQTSRKVIHQGILLKRNQKPQRCHRREVRWGVPQPPPKIPSQQGVCLRQGRHEEAQSRERSVWELNIAGAACARPQLRPTCAGTLTPLATQSSMSWMVVRTVSFSENLEGLNARDRVVSRKPGCLNHV